MPGPLLSTPPLYRPNLKPLAGQARPGFGKAIQPNELSKIERLLGLLAGSGTPSTTDQLDASRSAGLHGLSQAGLALLGAPNTGRRGEFMQNVAGAIGYGQQAGAANYQGAQADAALEGLNLPPQMLALLQAMPRGERARAAMGMMPQPEEPYNLGPGEQRRRGGALIAENPTDAGGYSLSPGAGRFDASDKLVASQPALPTSPLVTIDTGQKSVDQYYGEQFGKIQDAADASRNTLGTLDQLETLLADDAVYTGAGGESILKAKRVGAALGLNVEGVPEAEAVRAIANEIALKLRNPSGGAGMPGAMSDKDREFLVSMVPGLGNTKEGNKRLIEAMRRVAKRDVEVGQLARDYRRTHGQLDEGFADEIDRKFGGGDLFGDLRNAAPKPDVLSKYGLTPR